MPEDAYEKEYDEVKSRRSGGLNQIIGSFSNWQFVVILVLIIAIVYLWNDPQIKNNQIIIIGISVGALIMFFSKKAEKKTLISERCCKEDSN